MERRFPTASSYSVTVRLKSRPTRTDQKSHRQRRCFFAQAAEMAPMMKSTVMTKSALTAALAEACEVKRGVIGTALSTLASIATTEAKKNGKFVIPGVVMIKTRQKKATKAGKREIFGKVVMVKAKPAKTIVKAFPAKALKDEF
ncbi:unnamed protein product [Prorocentrum cordatum]|uniref:Major basic nuclear protein n=4 Tax=Prorocentrum TaxID=2944 RepID=A0ABN9TWI9_9DINO|nr:unnamed protein product [Polarella glacialis]